MNIERLCGENDKIAGNISNELIKDFQLATSYPPEERDIISADELIGIVQSLCDKIIVARKEEVL